MLSKLLKLIVDLGDSYGADRLIEIKSAHTILNIGLTFISAAAEILRKIAEAGLRVKVRTTADPIIDMTHNNEYGGAISVFKLQDQLISDLTKIGVRDYTCTPYYIDNLPKLGDHCAWTESSAVIYLNSVIGACSNREGGVVDLASAIIGKTPNYGLHLKENRKGEILFKILIDNWNTFDLTSIGLKIGEIAGYKIPVIDGLKNLSNDDLKNLGTGSAVTGAVALIHVIGITPEASNIEEAFHNDKPEEIIEIDKKSLDDVREKYSTEWEGLPKNIGIGCPQLSKDEVIALLKKFDGKKVLSEINFWIFCCEEVKNYIKNSKYNKIIESSGVKLSTSCLLQPPLPRPFMTNSGKACFYSNSTYRDIDTCIRIATEGK